MRKKRNRGGKKASLAEGASGKVETIENNGAREATTLTASPAIVLFFVSRHSRAFPWAARAGNRVAKLMRTTGKVEMISATHGHSVRIFPPYFLALRLSLLERVLLLVFELHFRPRKRAKRKCAVYPLFFRVAGFRSGDFSVFLGCHSRPTHDDTQREISASVITIGVT